MAADLNKTQEGRDKLGVIGRLVCESHDENQSTMDNWTDVLKTGIELSKPDDKAKSIPWDGSANYKSPIANEAVKDFGDKAVMEILGKPELVAVSSAGKKDPEIDATCERVTEHMNYQLNHEMKSWRTEQKNLFYRLAAQGSVFKKTWFDSALGSNTSEIVGHPNFSVNNKCSSLHDNHRFTQIKSYTPNEIFERQAQDIWLDVDLTCEEDDKNSADNDHYKFLEQIANFDLDDDGYAEPVLVTVHESSEKVVRIVAMWDAESITVKHDNKVLSFESLMSRVISTEPNPFSTPEEHAQFIQDETKRVTKEADLVAINPINILTQYNFMTPTDGTLLAHGYFHSMTSGIKGVNKTANALFNAGDSSNMQSGFLAKEFRDRKRRGNLQIKPNQWLQTNITASQLQQSLIPLPIKEPSQTLLALNGELKIRAKGDGH